MLKSRYNLEFLGIARPMKELDLEERLISRLQQFILELGYGFCFVGRQYRLALGKKEYFVDLLFYHRFLKTLVAFDLKIGGFEPEHAGRIQNSPRRCRDMADRRGSPGGSVSLRLCVVFRVWQAPTPGGGSAVPDSPPCATPCCRGCSAES
jgi:hypothetical protein